MLSTKKNSKIRAIVAFDLTVRRIFALKRVNNGPTFVSITTSFHSIFLSIDYRSPEIKVEINTYHMHPFQTVKTTTQQSTCALEYKAIAILNNYAEALLQ